MTPPPLRLRGVHKTLAGRPVLRQVSLTCPPGRITALLGPNGAGKTTTVAIASGLRAPDRGGVEVFGRPVGEARRHGRFGVVPQEIGFPEAVSVARCLDFVAGQRPDLGLAPGRDELCTSLGLTDLLDRRTGGLSGGQRRKLAVALGLVHAPGLVVMDEATTNLDEATRAVTWRLVRDYAERGGAALVTSHILADIDSHADRVVALNEGRVVLESPLADVRARLGGSTVSLLVPPGDRAAVSAAVAARRLGRELPVRSDGVQRWRTHDPLELVLAVAAVSPAAQHLDVRPTPLGELLAEVSGGATASELRVCR